MELCREESIELTHEKKQRREGTIMSISYDELIKQAHEQGESFELPDEVLNAIAGGITEQEQKDAVRFLARLYMILCG